MLNYHSDGFPFPYHKYTSFKSISLSRRLKTSLSISIALLLLTILSLLIFNAYAQQGGPATGGGAQINQGTGMTITCTVNNACIITGNSASGGPASGGNVMGSYNSSDHSGSSQIPKTNNPPIAIPTTSQTTVNENTTTVTLNGSKSYDPDGDKIKSFYWKQLVGVPVSLLNNDTSNPSFQVTHVFNDTLLKFSLRVTDDKDMNSENANNTITVTVKPVKITSVANVNIHDQESQSTLKQQPQLSSSENQTTIATNKSPIADAGQSQEAHEGAVVLLNGSKSYDPDGNPITFLWRQIGGQAVNLDNETSNLPSFTAPTTISTNKEMIFELTVKDNKGVKDSSTVTVVGKQNVSDIPSVLSSQNISLSVDKPAYVVGEIVNIKGKVKEVTEGDVRLDIYGPDGNPVNTVYADPVNNGDFSQSFSTISGYSKGRYTIAATYDGQTGSGQFNLKSEDAGMNNSSSSQNISLSVDKPAYVVGEIVNIKGKVKEVTEGDVRLDIYGPDGNPVNTVYADPVNNGDFSQSFSTISGYSKGQYTIAATYDGQTGSGQFNLKSEDAGMNNSSSSQNISLSVDKPAYVVGEIVNIKGKVKEVTEGDVRLDIYGPDGNPVNTVYADPVNNGDFSQSFSTISGYSKGQYTIAATYDGQTGSDQFNLK